MQTFSHAQIEQFKRKAKLNRQVSALPHSQALDLVAKENGYQNWSLLMKHSDTGDKPKSTTKKVRPVHQFSRSPELMRIALLKVLEPSGLGAPTRSDFAKKQVADISLAFVSAHNAVGFAIDYMNCLLAVPRFKVYSAAPAYWEMRSWLPYFCQPIEDDVCILVNRDYKLVGQVGKEWANYEEFPYLHTRITGGSRKRFTAHESSEGYLFNDGCRPWHSRADAIKYLDRLHILSQVLKGRIDQAPTV